MCADNHVIKERDSCTIYVEVRVKNITVLQKPFQVLGMSKEFIQEKVLIFQGKKRR